MARTALLNVMVKAALKAGRGLARDFGEVENLQVSLKGPGDFVSAADHRAEEVLIAELRKARPDYRLPHRGERQDRRHRHARNRWIVDPLDGTTNFLHGIPIFAISLGLERDGQMVAGVIYNPVLNELYVAERARGAFLNDRRLRVAARKNLADAVIATGITPHGARHATTVTARLQRADAQGRRASAAPARPRSTSPGSPPAASTATGTTTSRPGTSPPACSWCARRAASSPTPPAGAGCFATGSVVAGNERSTGCAMSFSKASRPPVADRQHRPGGLHTCVIA